MASLNKGKTVNTPAAGLLTLPAKSSFLSSFEYDTANLRLTVHFKSGAIYQYSFFLITGWDQLQQSQDHSSHYATAVKGKYAGSRVKNANKGPKNALPKPLDYKIEPPKVKKVAKKKL